MSEQLLTINEAAEILKVSDGFVRNLIAQAEIDTVKKFGKKYITQSSFDEFLKRKITGKPLPSWSEILSAAKRVPSHGVYFLIYKDEIVYIGQSKNVFSRIARHLREEDKVFSSYTIIETSSMDAKEFETRLINHFRPKYNIMEKPKK